MSGAAVIIMQIHAHIFFVFNAIVCCWEKGDEKILLSICFCFVFVRGTSQRLYRVRCNLITVLLEDRPEFRPTRSSCTGRARRGWRRHQPRRFGLRLFQLHISCKQENRGRVRGGACCLGCLPVLAVCLSVCLPVCLSVCRPSLSSVCLSLMSSGRLSACLLVCAKLGGKSKAFSSSSKSQRDKLSRKAPKTWALLTVCE